MTKVEEARKDLWDASKRDSGYTCPHTGHTHLCVECWSRKRIALEQAIREEERAKTQAERNGLAKIQHAALNAERVRVLEEVMSLALGAPRVDILDGLGKMLSEARDAEMVGGLVSADSKRVASSPANRWENLAGRGEGTTAPSSPVNVPSLSAGCPGSIPEQPSAIRPPSEHPTHYGPQGQCPHGMYNGCTPCEQPTPRCPVCNEHRLSCPDCEYKPTRDWPGSDRFTPAHLRKEPEPGGGRCPDCKSVDRATPQWPCTTGGSRQTFRGALWHSKKEDS